VTATATGTLYVTPPECIELGKQTMQTMRIPHQSQRSEHC
jgi:hypothetical protein